MVVSVIIGDRSASPPLIGLSPLAELVAQLHSLTERDHHTQDAGEPPNPDVVRSWAPLWAPYRGRFLFPVRAGVGRGLADELADIAELPIPLFAEYAGYAIRGGPTGVSFGRLLDDPAQRQQLIRSARLRSTARSELAARLLDSPATFRADLLAFLGDYARTCFEPTWRELRGRLGSEADRLRRRVHDRGIATALAELSPTAKLLDGPERVVFDKMHAGMIRLDRRPCVIVPSHYGWPHLLIKHEPGWPVVIQYGLRPPSAHPEVSLELLRARLLALTNPARMRICRLIARERLTTVELAELSGMTTPQVSRHLRALREVDLVRTEQSGRLVHYRLDLEIVRSLGPDLEQAMFR
jgi:DNA-binding transcriptional ArsR family regulator